MATSYAQAVETLYRGALDAFVEERKRLANEVKASGDKAAAARLGKLGRPSISAWTVNQLFWHEREAFDRLLATAERLKRGEHDVGAEHQRALSALRALASVRLASGGHAATESTLRRVTTTLSALAATGGFEPDPPGALVSDRDPPGFETFGIVALNPERAPRSDDKQRTEAEQKRAEAEQERRRVDAERRLLEEAETRKRVERERLGTALRAARADAVTQRRDVERLRHELSTAERTLGKTEATVAELKEALAALE